MQNVTCRVTIGPRKGGGRPGRPAHLEDGSLKQADLLARATEGAGKNLAYSHANRGRGKRWLDVKPDTDPRHGVVGKIAQDGHPHPHSLFGERRVRAASQSVPDLAQFSSLPIAPGLPLEQELAGAGLAAMLGEAHLRPKREADPHGLRLQVEI